MQRYFIQEPLVDEMAVISGDDAKHIQKVMRMQEGQSIIIVSEGKAYEATIERFEGQDVRVRKSSDALRSNELPIQVTICCGLPKGEKLDLITQKATELGMHELVLFEAERSIVKWDAQKGSKKQQRLQKIAKEAAEQSHRNVVPTIQDIVTFKQLLQMTEKYDVCFVADEEDAKLEKRTRFAETLSRKNGQQSICVVFGPEGGLSRTEIQALMDRGFQSISLGPRILRAETAPLYVLSAISYEFE
ncbi:16S rRNA (uracil(1498)-N(3))-methyltransferase [Paenisporosarcina quisquiliarum]|uniref:Ribosomal RNA small subunit methyltransferase E n=1 Tax=Paenisporosarcina quisquiliarum TaxID=365346 RepID=A0A9X3LDI9_9BACL|nr:16S rRNA (uracil(1498)-N(3))-methyltransferase [Paenisporosarcina quisquiliarum]MCZ8536078.1 16S rRNA (uracil(1498)-N(3))-methyltransferase [Paenisporosarcina quisquiliarum]